MALPCSTEYALISLSYTQCGLPRTKLDRMCRIYLTNREIFEGETLKLGNSSIEIKVLKCIPELSIVTTSTRFEFSCFLNDGLQNAKIRGNIVGMDAFMTNLWQELSAHLAAPVDELSPIGMLIEAPSTSGKTSILRNICNCYPHSFFLDCSSLQRCTRKNAMEMELEAFLFSDYCNDRSHVLLLDNIDSIAHKFPRPSTNPASSTQTDGSTATEISVSVGMLLCSLLDDLRSHRSNSFRPFVVATCSKSATLPAGLLRPYRLSSPHVMPSPDAADRIKAARVVIERCVPPSSAEARRINVQLGPSRIVHLHDEYDSGVVFICQEIARRTQGCGVADVMSIARRTITELTAAAVDGHVANESITLTTEALLEKVSILSFGSMLSSETATSSFLKDFSILPAPQHVFGYERVVQRMLRKSLLMHSAGPTESSPGEEGEVGGEAARWSRLLGVRACRGFLIHGPTGSGKTAVALRAAYEARSHFKLLAVSCAEIINKVVGESERKLSDIFAAARKMAPCFLLLDNIEVLLGLRLGPDSSSSASGSKVRKRRDGGRTSHQAIDRVLTTLLVELDGISVPKERRRSFIDGDMRSRDPDEGSLDGVSGGANITRSDAVIVIATSTCRPEQLDSSLTRPGRLEQHIELLVPDRNQRQDIVRGLLNIREMGEEDESPVNRLVDYFDGRSPAKICEGIQEASLAALRDVLRSNCDISINEEDRNGEYDRGTSATRSARLWDKLLALSQQS